jgi:hypothetical protein
MLVSMLLEQVGEAVGEEELTLVYFLLDLLLVEQAAVAEEFLPAVTLAQNFLLHTV